MFNKHSIHLALMALGYALGIALAFYWETTTAFESRSSILLLGLLLCLIFYSRKEPHAFWLFCFILAMGLGAQRMALENRDNHSKVAASADKQSFVIRLEKALKNTAKQERFYGRLWPADLTGNDALYTSHKGAASEKVLFIRTKDSAQPPLPLGKALWANGYLSSPNPPSFPGQFNYAAYLKTQGIRFQYYLTNQEVLAGVGPTKSVKSMGEALLLKMQKYKSQLLQKISQSSLSKASFQIYSALVFGDKKDLDPSLSEDYQRAGAIHILAISGLHIGIITGLLYGLLSPLRFYKIGRPLSGLAIFICLWAYAAFSGFSPSVVRAVCMFSFLSTTLFLKRPQYSIHLLVVAFCVNLIWDPLALFALGFQMSYMAVFFILLGMPYFNEYWQPKQLILKRVWQLFGVSICAQLGVFALSLYAFNQFPLLFLLSNLLIIPFLGLLLAFGIVLGVWFVFAKPPTLLVTSFNSLLELLNSLIAWLGGQDAFVIQNIYFPRSYLWASLCFIIGLLVWGYPYQKISHARRYFFLGVLLLQITIGIQKALNKQQNKQFLIQDRGHAALVSLAHSSLQYWHSDSLSAQTLWGLKKVLPYKTVRKKDLAGGYYFKEKSWLLSPQGPHKIKAIDYLLIDPKTKAYPSDFSSEQLENCLVIFSAYAQTKQMQLWKKWVVKNERPAWWLDAQGYYTIQ